MEPEKQSSLKTNDELRAYAGGGCGCKIPSEQLDEILENLPFPGSSSLLIDFNTRDDAAVYELDSNSCLAQTTDFFLPIVGNPFDFGKISAANAISDIYAMGAKPIMALSILAWPLNTLPMSVLSKVMEGAQFICQQAGIPIAGGHSIESKEPIFGLSVSGIADKKNLRLNHTVQEGDFIYISKPIGLGLLSAAYKADFISDEQYELLVETASRLNSEGIVLGEDPNVTAMTDITGFGLLGHLSEMLNGKWGADIYLKDVPLLKGIEEIAQKMIYPNITTNNYNKVKDICLGLDGLEFLWLCDPQTGGGLMFTSKQEMHGFYKIGRITDSGKIQIIK